MFPNAALLVISSLTGLHVTGVFTADDGASQIPHRRLAKGRSVYDHINILTQDETSGLDAKVQSPRRMAKLVPAGFLKPHIPRGKRRKSEDSFLQNHDQATFGIKTPSSGHRVTMEENEGVELYVSSVRAEDPAVHEEMLRLLDIGGVQHSSGSHGITEASTQQQKNVVGAPQERSSVWGTDGFFLLLVCFSLLISLFTCSLVHFVDYRTNFKANISPLVFDVCELVPVLYRLKEKHPSEPQLKEPSPPIVHDVHLAPVIVPGVQPPLLVKNSMVQASQPPSVSRPASSSPEPQPWCVISLQQTPDSGSTPAEPQARASSVSSTHSPFRMKPVAGLQERRGSNVSLVLDMSALGSVEPLSCSVVTPRERVAQEYLHTASRVLTRALLRETSLNTQNLQAEFAEIPMNFVDQKELDIPNHGSKNRYKSILPNPHSRVVLKTKNSKDPLSSYINANYIRGYLGEEKAFIATQGPMIHTVNDFWQMIWQEDSPIIVMITKLKEKNEKCVLYWPEKRGIYGKVEVFVSSVKESDHYIIRTLLLKHGGQSRRVQHYWYRSWPDQKTPEGAGPLLQLLSDVELDRRSCVTRGPITVHCSAGIGRTGCFIASSIGCHQLEQTGEVDILKIICQLRTDRGGMIQTEEQYEFVHHALSLFESQLPVETEP
ncbi:hypothetical protein DNTS_033760 [Danionella cerebrum]|uniref:protein-tyrosine-phosphatase n=1 Tax=Danionella cerebrum TaxID=2873325 RepID=A0A553RNC0_9TELE|nr:hypothetical protein DNTS_033760 [Danionella translucida]